MSVNWYLPSLLILPEDDANRELANGFIQGLRQFTRQIQVLPPAGGWTHVRDKAETVYVGKLEQFEETLLLLLVDFDDQAGRAEEIKANIPLPIRERVFVLGVLSEPEYLPKQGGREKIGAKLAEECALEKPQLWNHDLLRHNLPESIRLREAAAKILFGA